MYCQNLFCSTTILIVYTFVLQTNMLILHTHSICSVHSSSSGCFYYWKRRLRNPKQCSFCAKTRAENQYLTRDELSLSLQLVPLSLQSESVNFVQKSDNLQYIEYNTLGRWVAGMNDSLTKCLMFQALFFFGNVLQTQGTQNSSFLFLQIYKKKLKKKIETIFGKNFARNYEKK